MRIELMLPMALAALLALRVGFADLDRDKIAADFKAWDAGRNDGMGNSDSADSGSLGWGEASYLRNYSFLWETTRDPYWLEKIEDHFSRMIGNATDHDGDGFVGWQTATYSVGIYRTRPLHNVGTATIEPEEKREMDRKVTALITGSDYVIEFIDAETLRIGIQHPREIIVESRPYESGKPITDIPGITVTIAGETHSGDKFLVQTTKPEPTEFVVHEGMCAYPVALFIEAVLADEALEEQFGESARGFLEFMNRNFLQKHEQHWLDMGDGSGAYRFVDYVTDRFPNRVLPHNQFTALARAFLVLKDVEGADPLMGRRAEAMARYFHKHLREQDAAWVWNYWDWVEDGAPGSSGVEDTSHAAINVGYAIECCRRGVVFTDADLRRFTRTYLDSMWNGSEEDPKLGPSCGAKGDRFSAATRDWIDLCQWDAKIYSLALTAYEKAGSPVGMGPMMLNAEKFSRQGR